MVASVLCNQGDETNVMQFHVMSCRRKSVAEICFCIKLGMSGMDACA